MILVPSEINICRFLLCTPEHIIEGGGIQIVCPNEIPSPTYTIFLCMCNFLKYTLWTIYFSRRSFRISVIQSAEEKALNFTEFWVWKIAVVDLLRPFSNLLSCEKDWVRAAFLPYFTYEEEVKESPHFQRAVSCGRRSVSRWRRVAFEISVVQARMCISCRAVVL